MIRILKVVVFSIYSGVCISAGDVNNKNIDKPMQEVLSKLIGIWVSDVEYTEEYLQKGAELQKQWCGYGWTEKEIKRRNNFIRNEVENKGPLNTWKFRDSGDGSLELQVESHSKKLPPRNISNCKKFEEVMFTCDENPAMSRPFVIKINGKYLYILFKMTPQTMRCEIKSNTPR